MNCLVSKRIHQIITLKGIKKSRLASQLGLGRSSLSRFLNGRRDLPSKTVFELFEACGISLTPLLDRELNRAFKGEGSTTDIGHELEVILKELSYLERKTLLETFLVRGRKIRRPTLKVEESLERIQEFKQRMSKVRSLSC